MTATESRFPTALADLHVKFGSRTLRGLAAAFVVVVACAFSAFVFAVNSFWYMDPMRQGGLFAGMMMALLFLTFPALPSSPKDRPTIIDLVFAVMGAGGGFYLYFIYPSFVATGLQMTTTDYVVGGLFLIAAIEASRRTLGMWMTGLVLFSLVYALFGQYMPQPFDHFGVRWERLLLRLYMVDEGVFGSTFQVAQSFIAMFVLFGAFLLVIGASDAINNIGLAVSGKYSGGPAKVAVVASGMAGMISGAAAANVATTGTLTIPLMKRVGIPAATAGGIEAIASTGGLIMPPIMGSAAFLMADFLGIPYSQIALAAVIPALLYYVSLLVLIHVYAKKAGLEGLPASEIPTLFSVLRKRGHLLLPMIFLIVVLVYGYSPMRAAVMAIILSLVVSLVQADTRINLTKFVQALVEGAEAIIPVAMACLAAGFIVCVVTITGVAQVFTGYIEQISGGSLFLALLLTAIAAIIFSCALPGAAVYIVVAITVAPALIQMGAEPLAAHFFVFWFGVLSNITPPVAIACFVAAGIAAASPMKVAFEAIRMAAPAFILPFVIVYHPEFILINFTLEKAIPAFTVTIAGIAAYIVATEGFALRVMGVPMRLAFFVVALLCLVHQDPVVGYYGLGLGAAALVLHIRQALKDRKHQQMSQQTVPASATEGTS